MLFLIKGLIADGGGTLEQKVSGKFNSQQQRLPCTRQIIISRSAWVKKVQKLMEDTVVSRHDKKKDEWLTWRSRWSPHGWCSCKPTRSQCASWFAPCTSAPSPWETWYFAFPLLYIFGRRIPKKGSTLVFCGHVYRSLGHFWTIFVTKRDHFCECTWCKWWWFSQFPPGAVDSVPSVGENQSQQFLAEREQQNNDQRNMLLIYVDLVKTRFKVIEKLSWSCWCFLSLIKPSMGRAWKSANLQPIWRQPSFCSNSSKQSLRKTTITVQPTPISTWLMKTDQD